MQTSQLITRSTNLSCGHRVMNEAMLCYNLHGHEYITELTFSYNTPEDIGYAIDFKEIKRVFIQFLQDYMDHGEILNPKDTLVIDVVNKLGTRLWLMSLNGEGNYCNPTVENIAKEIWLAMDVLSKELYGDSGTGLDIYRVKVYETPNCYTECFSYSISHNERENWMKYREDLVKQYAHTKGIMNYDDRK